MLWSTDVGHGQLVEDTCLDQGIAEKHGPLLTINFAHRTDRKLSQSTRQFSWLRRFHLLAKRQTTHSYTGFFRRCLPLASTHDL